MPRSRDWPIAIRTLDLAETIQPITGVEGYSRVRVFVTDGPELVGSMDIWHAGASQVSAARLLDTVVEHFGYSLFKRDLARQLGPQTARAAARLGLPEQVSVSIVVPTCDRPDDLRRCLASLLTQASRRRIEIVVVDNRPGNSQTSHIAAEFPGVVLVDEPRPGLSYARNAGIARATGDIIIATDDDVTVPGDWLETLIAPFARPEVMAVTGHVLPLELETESQCRFEAYGGLGKGYSPFEADGEWFASRLAAVPTWTLGATANAAFRATIFTDPAIGLLEESLGAGMPTGCSEDTYLFYKILKSGHTIVYEPSAYVWHRHRRLMDSLRHQIYAYSKGHVAYHLLTLFRDGDRRALIRCGYSLPKTYVKRIWHRLRGWSDYPISLILLEVRGNLAGPWALWQSYRRVQSLGRSAPIAVVSATAPGRWTPEGSSDDGARAEPPVRQPIDSGVSRAS